MSHLSATIGVGFKPEHFASIKAGKPSVGFFEVHAENYMGGGGLPHVQLSALRADLRRATRARSRSALALTT